MSTRQDQLLAELADTFADGRTFDGDFLRAHDVTADECRNLSDTLAQVIRGYLASPIVEQQALLMRDVMDADDLAEVAMIELAINHLRIKGAQTRLEELHGR